MYRRTVRTASLAAAAIAMVALIASGSADAKGKKRRGRTPEKVFGGEILTSSKRFPTRARSARKYIQKLKKQRKDKFREDTEKKEWKIYYAAFFKRPLNDLEVTIKLWDISTGRKQLVSSFEQYLERRGETAIISYVKLERKFFGVNKKILMTVENHRGKVLAAGDFKILGKAERYSGQVSFTEEETKGAIDYDDDDDDE